MNRRYGKARVPECECTPNFTCGPCLRAAATTSEQIFGHDWADIQRAQQGGRLHKPVNTSRPIDCAPTDADRKLLAEHGTIAALKAAGFYGSADRLERDSASSLPTLFTTPQGGS